MFKFVAVRHGDANEISFFHKNKNLSKKGVEQIKSLAKLLKDNDLIPNVIYTSPKLRAKESAFILKEELTGYIFEESALSEPFDKKTLLNILAKSSIEDNIIFFVGHAPTISEFVNDLVGENALKNGLSKGHAALVVFEQFIEYGKGFLKKIFNP
jgi:phosphohistidine phosphatase